MLIASNFLSNGWIDVTRGEVVGKKNSRTKYLSCFLLKTVSYLVGI